MPALTPLDRSDKIRLLGFTTLHDSRRYTIPRCLAPSHPDTKARCAAMMISLVSIRWIFGIGCCVKVHFPQAPTARAVRAGAAHSVDDTVTLHFGLPASPWRPAAEVYENASPLAAAPLRKKKTKASGDRTTVE